MATSKLEIYQRAILHCRQTPVTSLNENNEARRLCDIHYGPMLQSLMEAGFWTHAMRTTQITVNGSVTPAFGYAYAHDIPADFVRKYVVSSSEALDPPLDYHTDGRAYLIEGGYLWSDVTPLYMRYTSNDASHGLDLGKWPERLTEAACVELACRICHQQTAMARRATYARQYASAKIAQITKQDPALAVSVLRGEQPGPAGLIRQLHSFRSTPYWHGRANRAGYGSDTVTRDDGTVEKVVPGMTVARGDADRDVNRRVDQFLSGVDKQVGGKVFDRLAPNVRAALVSVGYHTGYLPDDVAEAVRSGDVEAIAAAIAADGDEDGAVNRQVRLAEAAIARGEGGTPYEQIARRPAWADVLEPEQTTDLLDTAGRELERRDSRRALADRVHARQLGQDIRSDIRSVFSDGAHTDIDADSVSRELGPEKLRQWLEARQDATSVAAKAQNMPSLPDEQIAELVEAHRPEPGGEAEVFARRQAVHERLSRRASEIRRERRQNPARAAIRVPSVRQVLSEAQDPSATSPQKVQALVREMVATQSALGIAKPALAPVPDEWAIEIGKALTRIPTGQDNPETAEAVTGVRQVYADIKEQFGEFADEVIAHSIARTRALSSDMSRHVGGLIKSLPQG